MNGDSLEIMAALGTIHADLKQDIGNLKADLAGFKGDANARIAAIEADAKDQKFWNNVKAYSGPVMVALHVAARKIGINI